MKRTLALLVAALLLLAAVPLTASGEGRTELVMWGGWSGDSIAQFQEMLDSYNAVQDKVHITYQYVDGTEQKLLTAIAGGETCDVVLWDRFNTSSYAPKGALLALDEMVAADKVDLSKFFAPTVDELTYDGKLYGLPTMVDARVLFCNIDLLKEQAGGKLINDDMTPPTVAFNNEAGLAVLNFWDQMLKQDKVYETGFNEAYNGQAFIAGKAAMMVSGPWDLNNVKKAGINLGIIPCPGAPGQNPASGMGGFGLAIPALAAHPREAMDFIEWWACSAENSLLFTKINGYLPANVDAAADPYIANDPHLSALFGAFQYGHIRPKTQGYSTMESLAMIPQWQLFLSGEVTAQEALANAERQGNIALEEAALDY